jgi:tellurite resistance protein
VSKIRLTPNLFGIPFGLAGLAQCWQIAVATAGAPQAVADVWWLLAALAYLVVTVLYVGQRGTKDLADPIFSPFTALVAIVPMLLSVGLGVHAPTAGKIVYGVALAGTVLLGGWLTGNWILADLDFTQWHPAYFLPTAAGGLIAAAGAAGFGMHRLALVMLGYGVICWLVLSSILLLRLFAQPSLPPPLLPTMAIEVAPPVVAGNAYFVINGGHLDDLLLALTGYAVLMVLVQIRLIPAYRRAPFGPGWWSFSFSYAAVFAFALRWLRADDVPGRDAWTYGLLIVISLGILALAVRTGLALRAGRFFPTPAPVPANA